MAQIRAAIVDPSPEVRAAVAAVLRSEPDIEVVCEAGSLPELARLSPRLDVLVADFRACTGAHPTLKAFLAAHPRLRLIVTTSGGEPEYGEAAGDLAPNGWLVKTRIAADLVETLRRIPV